MVLCSPSGNHGELQVRNLIWWVLIYTCTSYAVGNGAWYDCDINLGAVVGCNGWTDAKNYPVKQSDGLYRDCDINMGAVVHCDGWSDAKDVPLLQQDGNYEDCNINMGTVTDCHGWTDAHNVPIQQ